MQLDTSLSPSSCMQEKLLVKCTTFASDKRIPIWNAFPLSPPPTRIPAVGAKRGDSSFLPAGAHFCIKEHSRVWNPLPGCMKQTTAVPLALPKMAGQHFGSVLCSWCFSKEASPGWLPWAGSWSATERHMGRRAMQDSLLEHEAVHHHGQVCMHITRCVLL